MVCTRCLHSLCGRPTTILYSALKRTIFIPFIRDTPCKGGNTGIIYEKPKNSGKGVFGDETDFNFRDLTSPAYGIKTKEFLPKVTATIILGVVLYEGLKWGIAWAAAGPTFGGSLVIAAATP